ncbi:hypothetical protein [Nakamurella lactea]|uniref:hypothetical protein n=1 Tax=Nakamurella lactea TaxID=459515 RepID=UPI0012B6441E|nr:hypothetical protein [Nakamurella lactea]
MTFRDLPDNIRDLSLDDPVLAADVVDLFCCEDVRNDGALAVLICDSAGRMVQPVLVDEMQWACPAQDRMVMAANLLTATAMFDGSLIVAFARAGSLVTDTDRAWHQTFVDASRGVGARLLGTYVAAPGRVVRLPDPEFLAAVG